MGGVSDLRGVSAGEACLVLGNGPSLTPRLLARIKASGVFGFAANGFCAMFAQSDYRPDAVCMSNFDAVRKFGNKYPREVLKFYKRGAAEVLGSDPGNLFELPFACEHGDGVHAAPYIKDGNFSLDPSRENFCGDTVLLDFALPVAHYMGFARYYIAGVDCDYSKGYCSKDLQISAKPGFKGMVHGNYSIAIPSWMYAVDFLRGRGCEVYKLTASPRLDFISDVSVEEIG